VIREAIITIAVKILDDNNSCASPFKDETYLFYAKIQCLPRSKHFPIRLYKTVLFILYKAKFTDLINELTDSYDFLFIKWFVLNFSLGVFSSYSLHMHLCILLYRNSEYLSRL
jgi:hypothetical protein